MPHYTDEPRNVVPKAKNWDKSTDCIMYFKYFKDEVLQDGAEKNTLKVFHWLFRKALANPGVTQNTYFEENGYEYNWRATWKTETKEMITNTPFCPNHPHSGSDCPICSPKRTKIK